jgi:VanZ family protein
MILWVASRPKTSFFSAGVKTIFGLPREWLQYPYHFTAFLVLAILFNRCISAQPHNPRGYKPVIFSLLGCFLVSLCSEGLQFYVPSRTPALRDIALDQSGALLGMVILIRRFSDGTG